MLTDRNQKTLSERVAADSLRQPRPMLVLRRWWSAAAVVVALAAGAVGWGWFPQWYESRPVTAAHQFIAHDCRRCHNQSWQSLERLVTVDPRHTSTSNQACEACHRGPVHHAEQLDLAENCSTCHREHRGHDSLARVADAYCTLCHADLNTRQGPSTTFAKHVASWSDHPEFALLRRADDPHKPGDKHGVKTVAVPHTPAQAVSLSQNHPGEGDSPPFATKTPQMGTVADLYEAKHPSSVWQDPTPLRFNHQIHLNPSGVFLNDRQTREVLQCQSCHQADAERRYMQPIRYDQHCARCHAPQLLPEMNVATAAPANGSQPLPQFDNRPVPHREPEVVRGAMRDRYTQYVMAHPDEARARFAGQKPPPNRELPGRASVAPATENETRLFVDQLMDQMQRKLLLGAGGCRYCHTLTGVDAGAADLSQLRIAPPKQPNRWFTHSIFRHDSHRFMTCTQCHADVELSRKTEHVLLPGIDLCRGCHQSQVRATAAVPHPARADCVECHHYHHRETESLDGGLDLRLQPVEKRSHGALEVVRP